MHSSSSAMQASWKLDRAAFVFLIVNLLTHHHHQLKMQFHQIFLTALTRPDFNSMSKIKQRIVVKSNPLNITSCNFLSAVWDVRFGNFYCRRLQFLLPVLAISIANVCNFYCQWLTTTREDPVENMTPDIVQQGFQIRWKLLCVYLAPTFFGQPGLASQGRQSWHVCWKLTSVCSSSIQRFHHWMFIAYCDVSLNTECCKGHGFLSNIQCTAVHSCSVAVYVIKCNGTIVRRRREWRTCASALTN